MKKQCYMEHRIERYCGKTVYRWGHMLHRSDGPAIIRDNGDLFWWVNDVRHREDGPAVWLASIRKAKYFLNHKEYSFDDYCRELNLDRETQIEILLEYG